METTTTTTTSYRHHRTEVARAVEARDAYTACAAALLPVGAAYAPGTVARDAADEQYELVRARAVEAGRHLNAVLAAAEAAGHPHHQFADLLG